MDIQRASTRHRRWTRYWPLAAGLTIVVALTLMALVLLNRAPGIDGERLWYGSVQRGELVREVAASGVLAAPRIRAVTNRNAGVVEEVLVLPGDRVGPDDPLLVMSSPDLEEELASARWDLAALEAEEAVQQVEDQNRQLDILAQLAQAEAEYTGALIELRAQEELEQAQVFSALEIERSRLKVEQLKRRLESEQARMESAPELRAAQEDAARARLARQRDKVAHLEQLIEFLHVPAGTAGIIQEVNVQEGERLTAGELVARIVDPDHLIARLSVPERQAAAVFPGLPVRLESGRDIIEGEVIRVDPTARNRHIEIDVALTSDSLPPLRPDQSISGRIELERLEDVVYLPRPAAARDEGQEITLFRVDELQRRAERVTVTIGRLSAREAEVISGLEPGDRVILAEMSDHDNHDILRIR